jgi:arsenate reductase (thioredoxin)
MTEGILRNDGGETFEVYGAGVMASAVRPEAIQAMREIGIAITGHRSKSVDVFAGQEFDCVIIVCDNAKETCPVFSGKAIRIHQSFEGPPRPGAKSAEETISILWYCFVASLGDGLLVLLVFGAGINFSGGLQE